MENKMAESRNILEGGAIACRLISPKPQCSFFNFNRKAFSIAEATIALLIGGLILGIAAPMISKQIKNNTLTDTQLQVLQKQINDLKRNQNGVEDGAVMFYATDSCPENWAKLSGFGGYYLRIQNAGETIGSIKEQMVHRHKHVSPIIAQVMVNNARYGPYASSHSSIIGDATYPARPSSVPNDLYFPYPHTAGWGYGTWFNYTSDGMNRVEKIMRHSTYSTVYDVKTCPNRDEGDTVCKNDGSNNYDVPYLSDMPLVGDENRPNSLVLTACVKGYTTCSMVDNKLNCTK